MLLKQACYHLIEILNARQFPLILQSAKGPPSWIFWPTDISGEASRFHPFFFLFIFFSIFSFFFFFCQSTHFVNSQNMMLSICLFIYSFLLKVRGDLVLNGLTTSCVDLAERVAYIQKDCNLCGDMTVRQTLLFTALLQAPGRPNRNVDTKGRVRAPPLHSPSFPPYFPSLLFRYCIFQG